MQTCEWDTARLDWRGIQPNEIGWRTVRVFFFLGTLLLLFLDASSNFTMFL